MAQPPFEPFIPPQTSMRELTVRAVVTGTLLGVVFGASSLYLALKVGLTVSASIPVAVISLALFRALSKFGARDATILENNITQTAGSSGESLAFGVGVTMPAIMILGFDLDVTRVMTVAVLGGLLGILMMIPLRRALIVKEHGRLKYPEGTACAAVLIAGASDADRAASSASAQAERTAGGLREGASSSAATGGRAIFAGFGVGLVYKVLNLALRAWRDVPEKIFGAPFPASSISAEISPELLGVGYIIGPRIGSIMCAGGVLAYLVLIPMIKFFGFAVSGPVPPGTLPISQMGPADIRSAYVLYIGAGAVAAGGIISLLRSLPVIWQGLRGGLRDLRGQTADIKVGQPDLNIRSLTPSLRTDRDLPIKFVGIGIIVLLAAIAAVPSLHMNLLGALLIVVFGFLFVTVSSRLTGEIGNSSNPVSGMTIATLLLTCLIFLIVGWTGGIYYVTALSVGAIVCVAATNAGATSQDLKTGHLLGATPRYQQIAIMCGCLASALTLGPILLRLNAAGTVYVPAAQVAAAGLQADVSSLTRREKIAGVQARDDGHDYWVWHKTDLAGGRAGEYLVDDGGRPVWFVDPGINGAFNQRPDGSNVRFKFSAPKATLMSYIIKGILGHQLPWGFVLLGVMTSVTLEMCGVSSLAFAVGVYLPLSASTPIFIGGMLRGLVDWHRRRKLSHANLSEEQHIAEGDKSAGVLVASGYIAGGAIAGIAIAILSGVPSLESADNALDQWATVHNPFFAGPHADALSLLPFALLCGFLYLVAREKLLAPKKNLIMPDDRETILARVRAALAPLPERAAAPEYDPEIAVLRRMIAGRDPLAVFTERLERLNGVVLTEPEELPVRLRAGGWTAGYCDPALWPRLAPYFAGFQVEAEFDRARVDDYAFGITRAAGAIAESGTIILNDATTSRRLGALAPWVHVAVVERAKIFTAMPEAVAALGSDPNVVWCTGPSRTADVEGILIRGVHGPGVEIALVLD